MSRVRQHLISCRVFQRELEALAPAARTEVRIQYLEMGLHEKAGEFLHEAIQKAVDAVEPADFDAISLGYGLCNRGIVGLTTRELPLVIPRAHDCLGLLLGSSARYLAENEKEPGTYFQSPGWIENLPAERGVRPMATGTGLGLYASEAELIAQFGEDNARFLLEEIAGLTRHYQRLAFVASPACNSDQAERKASELAQRHGWNFEKLQGDPGWLRRLLDGDWGEREFLVLKPGERVGLRYDGTLIGADPA